MKDEEKRRVSEVKSGKRLSKKPPPVAMETQKMPSALRRSSWFSISSAQQGPDERTSRDLKRLSGMSFNSVGSSLRSHSTPATSAEEVAVTEEAEKTHFVSQLAPKLPSFRFSSRSRSRSRSSSHARKSSKDSDISYENDLVAFAYRLDATSLVADAGKREHTQASQNPRRTVETLDAEQQIIHPALRKALTEPSFGNSPVAMSLSPQPSPSLEKPYSGNEKSTIEEQRQQSPVSAAKDTAGQVVAHMADYKYGSKPLSPRQRPPIQTRSSHDGGSYVHKQRMYEQQRSIAGFEDQQAVQVANELAAEYEALLAIPQTATSERGRTTSSSKLDITITDQYPEPLRAWNKNSSTSPASVRRSSQNRSPHLKPELTRHEPRKPSALSQDTVQPEDDSTRPHPFAARPRQSLSEPGPINKPLVTAGATSGKIFGFRRRAKEPPAALISVPYAPEDRVAAVQSAPLETLASEEPAGKRSKIDQLFRAPKPAFVQDENRQRSGSFARSSTKEDGSPDEHFHIHNRARTASSTVLIDNIQLSKSLPQLPAEQEANAQLKPLKSALKRRESDQPPQLYKTESQSEPLNIVKLGGSGNNAGQLMNKATREVIVESETGDGLIRKASLTRSRSNPQINGEIVTSEPLPSLDFLPQLKHQPLPKRERQSPTQPGATDTPYSSGHPSHSTTVPPTYSTSPTTILPSLKPSLNLIPRSALRTASRFPLPTGHHRASRSATDIGTITPGKGGIPYELGQKPLAKLFVICCQCRFWHDMPSKIYEAMALPVELHRADAGKLAGARLDSAVKCPWCEHAMTTQCCEGWTTVVYMHERHH